MIDEFTYLGSTMSSKLSLDKEIESQIDRAASNLARLGIHVWKNPRLTFKTKVSMYRACVLSKLFYGCESWKTYGAQECRLNIFNMRLSRNLLIISPTNRTQNSFVLSRKWLPTMFTMLRQRRLGHIRRHNPQRYFVRRAHCW